MDTSHGMVSDSPPRLRVQASERLNEYPARPTQSHGPGWPEGTRVSPPGTTSTVCSASAHLQRLPSEECDGP
eukprot:2328878-Rhodomonas_salina.2